ncbi:MAG: dihydrolipoyl dehydrogenase [Thermobacillus sp.]|uniref:dihydrolipoyl dehydrogenase n=1 Tax=Thermobacillus sp. TaxID=2108467 RepID=UPI000E38CC20|nr:dihydrolipoyl dehydrogenase [Thermobacillus sp.]REJ13922.1 MAG: dihydrolipoyl dehydrogenase [Paenibacillaceae bacterium]REK57535.1 MAG: dihydrolipoyl dehydrogenase [Thermobacillus sp.]
MTIHADVAVLGGGPGGYTAAIRAAQLGKKAVIIEQDRLGGVCLNRGCIPSKSLLRSAEVFHTVKEAARYGIAVQGEPELRYDAVLERKRAAVEQLYRGLTSLMKKHNIEVIHGKGRIIGPSIFSPRSGSVAVELENGEMETVVPQQLIIATGSRPRELPGLKFDGIRVLSSDDALNMETLPRDMLIVGGGVIGIEWASMLNDFGVAVTLVEAASRLLPGEDADVSAEMERLLRRRGVRVITSAKLLTDTFERKDDGVAVKIETGEGAVALSAERMLVAIGRTANVDGIGLEATDVAVKDGFIAVNASYQTAEPHIYAVGDVIGGVQLAHAAAREGVIAAEHIAGLKTEPLQPHRIPRCIYSRPEVASIGLTESQALSRGHDVKTSRIPFRASGKAIVLGETDGFVKVIADRKTGDILGVHMIGPHVTELLSEAGLADLLNASVWEAGQLVHPHPSLSEMLGEAMLAIDGVSLSF